MTLKRVQTSTAIVLGALLVIMSCNENSKLPEPANALSSSQTKVGNSNARIANYTFDGTEGGAIALDVATRWISNYSSQNSGKVTAHFFGRKGLEKMLSTIGSMGIRFYYSIDDAGNPVVFATGADSKGNDFSSTYKTHGRNSSVAINAGPSTTLFTESDTDSTALTICNRWKGNYNKVNPYGMQAHFLGFEIIKQILSAKGCVGIRCYYALNDSGVQQLLLIGTTVNGQNILPSSTPGGRTEDSGTIGDISFPCPTYCSGS